MTYYESKETRLLQTMAKVTSRYQVTMPKKIAERYSIRPGDEIDRVAAGDVIRVIPPGNRATVLERKVQHRLFDQATERQRQRNRTMAVREAGSRDRGWNREDLYRPGRSE